MLKFILFLGFWICAFFFTPVLAQDADPLEPWMDLIQDDPAIAEILENLLQNPVEVNQADKQEWQRIPLLSAHLVNTILSVRQAKGSFTSVRQIRKIVGANTYQRIRPFLVLKKERPSRLLWTQRNYRTVETPPQIQDHSYLGDNLYNYSKFTLRYDRWLSAGFILQKDIGEKNFGDYYNGFVRIAKEKYQLIAGSFYAHFGQGLVFSSPFGRMKSAMVLLPFSARRDGAAAYIGSGENSAQTGFLFGIHVRKNNVLRFFLSHSLRDGQYNPTTLQITDFVYSGYHRTFKEENQKDLISEQILGLNFSHHWAFGLKAGFTAARFFYRPGIHFDETNVSFIQLRKRYFHFKGNHLNIGSVYYDWENSRFHFSGEWAVSNFRAPAFSQALLFKEESVYFGFLFWHLSKIFQSPAGRVFDNRNPFPQGEQGLYGAVQWNFSKGNFRFYKVLKKKLWRGYFSPLPILKDEWLAQGEWRFLKINFITRLRQRSFEEFSTQKEGQEVRTNHEKTNLRVELQFLPRGKIGLRTRVEFCQLSNPTEKGFLTFQDLRFRWLKNFQTNFRVTFFRTHSFNTGIYEYESDVPGSFSNYVFYGQGFKWYVNFSWQINRHLKVWLKYRYLMLNKRNFTVIDYGRIEKPLQRFFRAQMQVTF